MTPDDLYIRNTFATYLLLYRHELLVYPAEYGMTLHEFQIENRYRLNRIVIEMRKQYKIHISYLHASLLREACLIFIKAVSKEYIPGAAGTGQRDRLLEVWKQQPGRR